MGGKMSSDDKKDLMNNSKFRDNIKKTSNVINNMTTSMLQSNLTKAVSNAKVDQSITIGGITAAKDNVIENVGIKGQVSMNVSALSDSKLKDKLVQDLTSSLQTKLQEMTTSTQKQLDDQDEQVFSDIISGISDTMQTGLVSATGGQKKEKSRVTVQNLVDAESTTELNSLVKNSINNNIVDKTVTKVASTLLGKQVIKIQNVTSTEGKNVIRNINEDFLSEQITKIITESDMSEEVISTFTSLDKTEITHMTKVDLDQTKEQKGAVEEVARSGFGALKWGMFAVMTPLIVGVIGIVVVVIFVPALFGGGGKTADTEQVGDGPDEPLLLSNPVVTYVMIALITYFGVETLIELYYIIKPKENFHMDKAHSMQVVDNADTTRYVGVFGDKSDEVILSENDNLRVRIHFVHDNYAYIRMAGTHLYLRYIAIPNHFRFDTFNTNNSQTYKFEYIPIGNKFILKQGGVYMSYIEGTWVVGDTIKDNALLIKFVESEQNV